MIQQYHMFESAHLNRVAFEARARECGLVFGAQRANGRVVLGHRTLLRELLKNREEKGEGVNTASLVG